MIWCLLRGLNLVNYWMWNYSQTIWLILTIYEKRSTLGHKEYQSSTLPRSLKHSASKNDEVTTISPHHTHTTYGVWIINWTANDHSPKVKDIICLLSVRVTCVCLSVRALYAPVLITQPCRSTFRYIICTAWCHKKNFLKFLTGSGQTFCIPVFLSYCLPG